MPPMTKARTLIQWVMRTGILWRDSGVAGLDIRFSLGFILVPLEVQLVLDGLSCTSKLCMEPIACRNGNCKWPSCHLAA